MADQLTNKFVAVLNEKVSVGVLMNALAHMSAGLSASYPNIPEMRFDDYVDKDENRHKSISDHPFIILKAENSNQIRKLRNDLIHLNLHFVDFTSTMTVGTYEEQKYRTKQFAEQDLEYYGICAFGDSEELKEITKKFSLWR